MTLEFITKKRPYRRYHEDVTIKAFENKNRKGVSFLFKNKAKERITSTGYLSAAIAGDRLYFGPMAKDEGYKASDNGAYTFRTNILDDSLYEIAKNHAGGYDLEHDEELGYWYVELK